VVIVVRVMHRGYHANRERVLIYNAAMRPASVVLGAVIASAACGSGSPAVDAPSAPTVDGPPGIDARVNPPGEPRLGAHALRFFRLSSDMSPLDVPIASAGSGSTIVASTGRGAFSAMQAPTDNRGNAFSLLGTPHTYTRWSSSGTALYAATGAAGGANHVVTADTPPSDEITMGVVEVLDGATIQDAQWVEVLAPPLISATVTTTGPATLIAFWWGDADVDGDKTAVPDNGFVVIDSVLEEGALVQCAVATRDVAAAGTYSVTWTATPIQGAQMYLVAVQ
jgi:hypothetical protein